MIRNCQFVGVVDDDHIDADSLTVFDPLDPGFEVINGGDMNAEGEVTSNNGSHILSNKKNQPFDMPHPNKEGW